MVLSFVEDVVQTGVKVVHKNKMLPFHLPTWLVFCGKLLSTTVVWYFLPICKLLVSTCSFETCNPQSCWMFQVLDSFQLMFCVPTNFCSFVSRNWGPIEHEFSL